MRLRSCEEGEINTPTVWDSSLVGLNSENKGRYRGRRTYSIGLPVCVSVCQRVKMILSWMGSWLSGSTWSGTSRWPCVGSLNWSTCEYAHTHTHTYTLRKGACHYLAISETDLWPEGWQFEFPVSSHLRPTAGRPGTRRLTHLLASVDREVWSRMLLNSTHVLQLFLL